jgi:hypothetical protein
MATPCMKPRRLTYRLSKSAELFLLGAVTRNERNKKGKNKTKQKAYMLTLCGLSPFDGHMTSYCH